MQTKRRDLFTTVRTEGAILPADLLQRIADGDRTLEGLKPEDFHRPGERLNEVINAAWNRLLGHWQAFQAALGKLPENDAATSVTRERWLLPLFRELDYGRLAATPAVEIDGKSYPVSHGWQKTPIHLVGWRIDMDRRTAGVAGAARTSPHSLVQELLNRCPDRLWGFVSNGRRLRILRDNISLTRQAFVDFDLEAMMGGEVYADFALLWLLCHQSRVEAERPEQCWLEKWSRAAQDSGTRALDSLRQGVEEAIKALGRGFLAHPANATLREKLRIGSQQGGLDTQSYYRQILRLVYRLLFLFAAEDRGLLLLPSADEKTRQKYARYYSTARLRHLAERHRGTRHCDLFQGLALVMEKLGTPGGCPELGLPALGSFLWSDKAVSDLLPSPASGRGAGGEGACRIANTDFLEAVRALAFTVDGNVRRAVDYKNLGAEELGSVYESLLELHPKINADAATFELDVAAGHERKTTGSYYTPTSLINCLLDSALDPVMDERLKEASRLASGDWRTDEEKQHAYSVVSRSGCLAARYEAGRVGLPAQQGVSQGGVVRHGEPDSPRGSLDPSEHRRGLGTPEQPGVPAISADRSGQSSGIGDPRAPQPTSRACETGAVSGNPRPDRDPQQTDSQSQPESPTSQQLAALWDRTPLATRYSLLAEQALLALKVCDPACGSGHFLIAAAHRIARCLAAVRSGDEEPAPEAYRQALREVIGRSIFGVDINPMAVELCKINLWLESLEPGKPLSFLDHHIQCGNSLLGATPALLNKGIPDEAFEPIEGDDKKLCREYKKQNRDERRRQKRFDFDPPARPWERLGNAAVLMANLDTMDDDSLEAVRRKEQRYAQLVASADYLSGRFLADTWCAAFVWKKTKPGSRESAAEKGSRESGIGSGEQKLPSPDSGEGLGVRASSPTPDSQLPTPSGFDYAITEDVFRRIERNPHDCPPWMRAEIQRLARQYQFFHWHLAFPQVFRVTDASSPTADSPLPTPSPAGWSGGFDCVLGNPPWERIKLQEKEFFATRKPDIANAPNAAARRRMIAMLAETDPPLYRAFREALRRAEGESTLVRQTDRYPLCGRGDVNTYSIFAELKRSLLNPAGRAGCIVPSGIATDDTTKFFFQDLIETGSLVSLYDFENRKGIFPDVDSRMKFCLLTMRSPHWPFAAGHSPPADFVFFAHEVEDLADPERHFTLTGEEIALINPNTRTCPIFRYKQDAELTKHIYRRVPVLLREGREDQPEQNPWGLRFMSMFHMANDSHLFRTREQLEAEGFRLEGNIFCKKERLASGEWRVVEEYLPLYEAKMAHQFDHRWATYDGPETRDLTDDEKRDPNCLVQPRYWVPASEVEERLRDRWDRGWLLGWRDITNTTNERTVIGAVIPRVAVGDKYLLALPDPAERAEVLTPILDAAVLDYCARQKVGGTSLKYFTIKQFPVLAPSVLEQPFPFALQPDESPLATGHSPAPVADFLRPRVLELTYTAWDLEPFARDCGYDGPPFRWDQQRRFLIRCELDAMFFHLYLPSAASGEWRVASRSPAESDHWPFATHHSPVDETPEQLAELKKYFPTPRDAVAYIMETFPIVKRKDVEKYGTYRTKDTILEIYDEMQRVMKANSEWRMASGKPDAEPGPFAYQTRLDPPPGPPAGGLPDWQPGQPRPANWPSHIHPPREHRQEKP